MVDFDRLFKRQEPQEFTEPELDRSDRYTYKVFVYKFTVTVVQVKTYYNRITDTVTDKMKCSVAYNNAKPFVKKGIFCQHVSTSCL